MNTKAITLTDKVLYLGLVISLLLLALVFPLTGNLPGFDGGTETEAYAWSAGYAWSNFATAPELPGLDLGGDFGP